MSIAAFGSADIRIDADQVLPARFMGTVSLSQSHRGDVIQARIDGDRFLPNGTELSGRILEVRRGRDKEPGLIEMEFDSLRMPDGQRYDIRALPVKLDRRAMTEGRDGRWTIKKSKPRSENVVFGSGAVGLILGTIVKRPFEGTLIGLLAGIVFNETGALDNDVAIKDGDRIGALFTDAVTLRYDDRSGQSGWRGTDPWERPRNGRQPAEREPRPESRGMEVRLGDREIRFDRDAAPYFDGEVAMVPIESTAEQLGLKIDRSASGRTVYLESDDDSVKIDVDADNFRLNGRRTRLTKPAVMRDGVIYAPIEILANLSDQPIFVNGNRIGKQP